MNKVRGRFAPSPSGEMHLGNAWTALLAWLEIRKSEGTVVLRMEDLDPDRSRPEYASQIIQDLRWLGLDWDEGPDCGGPYGPYIQHERRALYQQFMDKLAARGLIYSCYCSRTEILAAASAPHSEGESSYPGTCRQLTKEEQENRMRQGRQPALRLKVTDEPIAFQDGIHGRVVQNLKKSCGDFIVRRSDGIHAYQLAVVIDDALMHISNVLRGYDLLTSTARQLYLYHLFGMTPPKFTHVPLLYSPDGHRLSKRQKDLSVAALRTKGVTAETIIGFLAWKAHLIEEWRPITARKLVSRFLPGKIPHEPVVVAGELD